MQCSRFGRNGLLALVATLGPGAHAESVEVICGKTVVKVEAIAGEPFGVGRVVGLMPTGTSTPQDGRKGSLAEQEELCRATLTEASGRILYPARMDRRFSPGSARVEELKEASAGIFFLFRGKEPLSLSFSGLGAQHMVGKAQVKPSEDGERLKALQAHWWMFRKAESLDRNGLENYDRSAEIYLDSMLAHRTGSAANEPRLTPRRGSKDEVLGLLMGLESIRLAMQKDAFLGKNEGPEAALHPLPPPAAPPEMPVSAFDESRVQVEPLAKRVPASCFYLHSGSFDAFIQLLDLLDDKGTAARSLFMARGTDQAMKARIERQLALRTSTLSRLLGGMAIKEMAFLGRDTFFCEGSAVGVLMQAKNSSLLASHLEGLRKELMAQDSTLRETHLELSGKPVSLLENAGNGVRSFYVQDGEYHLVTNSRWIAEAFLATQAHPETSLGSIKAFRYARSKVLPSSEGAFIYLSDAFFRDLVGPAYRVEMTRRARVDAELSLVAMAQAAAQAEGRDPNDLPGLIAQGFLPASLGLHPDGSKILLETGKALDSLRGERGSLLPIPDMPEPRLTQTELEAYQSFSSAYQRLWTNMDPVYGSLRWKPSGAQQIALELHISPYVKSRYAFLLRFLGEPSKQRIAPVSGDLLSVELHPKLTEFREDEDANPVATTFFGGLRDLDLSWRIREGEVERAHDNIGSTMEGLRGYLGQTPTTDKTAQHFLDLKTEQGKDAEGFMPLRDGLRKGRDLPPTAQTWGREWGHFFIAGTGRELVKTVSNRLKQVPDTFPAQVRLRVGDLKNAKVSGRIRAELYARDRRTSAGGALLLQSLQEQFNTQDPRATARKLLGFEPLCPLGGTYRKDATGRWISTAWKEDSLRQVNAVPETYQSPLQVWIKSLSLDLAIDDTTLNTRLVIEGRR